MRIALLVALLLSASAHADNTVAAAEPPFNDGDRAFMSYVSQRVAKHWQDGHVAAWYAINLDEDPALERVAVVCGPQLQPGFYLIEKDPTHRWQLMFYSYEMPECEAPGLPPLWERLESAAIVHHQSYKVERGNRLIYAGFNRVYLALRNGVPVILRDEVLDGAQTRIIRASSKISRPEADGNLYGLNALPFQVARFGD